MADRDHAYFLLVAADEAHGQRFVKLRSPTVFDWFVRVWRRFGETGNDLWREELGGNVYGFGSFFEKTAEAGVSIPRTPAELPALLEKYAYYERDLEAEPHFIHVETDDDEIDIEYFFFDDELLRSPDALDRLPPSKRRAGGYAKLLDRIAAESE